MDSVATVKWISFSQRETGMSRILTITLPALMLAAPALAQTAPETQAGKGNRDAVNTLRSQAALNEMLAARPEFAPPRRQSSVADC